ncbi:MAG: HAMP domain-containing histidine kinase [Clostridiales bacterium]|nr:HAMP domain-containing histidine kinase [Clostridiales bacterium]
MKKQNSVSVYHPNKRDAFFLARFRFTAFCGLLALLLLGLLFTVTFSVMNRLLDARVNTELTSALTAAKRGESQVLAGGECLLISETPMGTIAENCSQYQSQMMPEMLTHISGSTGSFRLDGHTYCYKAETLPGRRIVAVYDATSDGEWLSTFQKTLYIGFFAGVLMVLLAAWMYSNHVIKPTKEALNKQRELIANASHELKTPLTVLSANLSLLSSEPNSTVKENEQWLTAANAQIARMNTLVYDMLELCKLEGGSNTYASRAETDVTSVIEGAVLCMEAGCFEKGIALTTDTEPVVFSTNKEGVEKLIFILLDNAMKYTPAGGRIHVELKKKKRGATIAVSNTGAGLTEEQRKRIFDRFYKAERQEGEGAPSYGLGLSIAKELCKQLGGSIDCSSVLGQGVTFTVTLSD